MEKNTLGEIIYYLRKKAGLTQEALADGICSSVSVSRIENGNQMPSGKVLEQLLERLGTGTYQLCNVYYENECQASLHQTLSEIDELVLAGDFMQDGTAGGHIEAELVNALRLTKPNIDLDDCRGELLSPTEVNLLVLLTTAKYMAGKNLEAIRTGEEVMFALDRNQSRLSDYKVLQINLAHNLSQIMQDEGRYQEALLYAKKAEELSIRGTEQFMLPEIEFGIAQILNNMGKLQESRTRMEALIPYMRLIGKIKMADLAQEYLDKNLSNDVS